MQFAKRIVLFLLVNVLVVTTVSIILSVFNVQPYMNNLGINYTQLAIFCLIWGFAGSFISLALSRVMAKWMMRVKVIDPTQVREPELIRLVERVHSISQAAGLPKMPQVGVYESPEVNAFATGPTKSRALVAVSTGLLSRMNDREVEGVLAHEVAHIANGDMVTLTLIQGVVNAFTMFIARALAFAIGQFVHEDARTMVRFGLTIFLDIVFSILGSMVVARFSRAREFRADSGSATLVGKQKMIEALTFLRNHSQLIEAGSAKPIEAFKISGHRKNGFLALFSTHPSLDDRIARLQGAM